MIKLKTKSHEIIFLIRWSSERSPVYDGQLKSLNGINQPLGKQVLAVLTLWYIWTVKSAKSGGPR